MTAGNYSKTILDNGIRIVSEKMEGVRSVSVGVWILIGSRNESRRNCGISHLLEHMLFKGTESRTAFEIAVSLESLGGTLNAFTDREFTCIYAVVLDDNVSEAVEVMADVILNPVLDEKDLRVEKQVVLEEIRNLEDSPEDRIHEVFVQTVFNNRSLGSSTLGTYESIRRMKKSDLSAYHNKFCAANNIIIAAAGCIDHDFFVDCVSKYFHALNRGADSVYEQFVLGQDFNRSLRSSISQSHICTGMPSFSYDSPEKISLIVLNSILGGGMSSRLFQEIREKKGLAYTIYSFFDFWSDTGL
ncbi:MAG: pitrilysin family protein, partial [bacterium]